jgi:hypothetical protein
LFFFLSGSQPFLAGGILIIKKNRGTAKILQITCKLLQLKVEITVFTISLNCITKIEEIKCKKVLALYWLGTTDLFLRNDGLD